MRYDIYTEIISNIENCLAPSEEISLLFNGINFKLGHNHLNTGISKMCNDMKFSFFAQTSSDDRNTKYFKILVIDNNASQKNNFKLSCKYVNDSFSSMNCYLKKDDGVDFFEIQNNGDKYILESKYYDRDADEYIAGFYSDEGYYNYSQIASLHGIVPDRYVSHELTKEEVFTTINKLIRNPKETSESLFVENKKQVGKAKIKHLKSKTTN